MSTVARIGRLFIAAKGKDMTIGVSPDSDHAADRGWPPEGPLEKLPREIGMFDHAGPATLKGIRGSGAVPRHRQRSHT